MVFGIGEISDCKFSTELRMVFCFQNCSGHTLGKNCYSMYLENRLKFKAEGREFAKFLRSVKQFTVRGLYIFDPIFHFGLYFDIVERLILQTIYVINKEILQFLGLKSAVHNQERFKIKSGL